VTGSQRSYTAVPIMVDFPLLLRASRGMSGRCRQTIHAVEG
jgi:hypothetical protein